MVVEDTQFLNDLKGKRVKLTLKTSSYLGVVQRINPNKTLVLAEVVSGSDGCRLPGSKLFFGHEIVNVEFATETSAGGGGPDHGPRDQLDVDEFQPYRQTIPLGKDEEGYIDFVVIDEFHEKFGAAVMHIKKQQVIGVGVDGVGMCHSGRLCWLQIATKNKIYLFDILLLGARAFKNGLSMILGNKHTLKVIHDCRAIAGCLLAQFGVKLTNVFDTQVADVMYFHSNTGGFLPDRVSTLQEVVNLHLKVSPSQMLSHLAKEERLMWQKRPCPVPLLKVMALSVIHLQPLRLVLLDSLMMDYMALVDSYLNSSHYQPDQLDQVSRDGVLELPTELRMLEQMRCERRQWAAERYPVTERGLLARFKPRPASPPAAAAQQDSYEPATVEPGLQVNPTTDPPRVADLSFWDPQASPDSAAPPAPVSDLRKDVSVNGPSGPVGVGRGRTDAVMDTMGRGRPFGKEQSSIPPLSPIGRGFLLQISQAQNAGDIEPPGRNEAAPSCL